MVTFVLMVLLKVWLAKDIAKLLIAPSIADILKSCHQSQKNVGCLMDYGIALRH